MAKQSQPTTKVYPVQIADLMGWNGVGLGIKRMAITLINPHDHKSI